jgi:FKBP-type peptidyl-prolyl cis-trans isomerase 2
MFQQANIIPTTGQAYQIGGQIVTVKEILENEVIVDANHPMAGKTLIFEITLKSIE